MKQLAKICLFFIFLLGVTETAVSAPNENTQLVLQLSQEINAYRQNQGLYPLQLSSTLSIAAQEQVTYMAQNELLSHTGRDDSTAQSRASGAGWVGDSFEMIYRGSGGTQAVLSQWLANADDAGVVGTGYFRHFGLAIAQNNGVDYWVVVFGLKSDEVPPVAGEVILAQPVVQVQPAQAAVQAVQPAPQPELSQILPTPAGGVAVQQSTVQVQQAVPTLASVQSADSVAAVNQEPQPVPTFISSAAGDASNAEEGDSAFRRIVGAPLLLIAIGAFLIAVLILLFVWWSESRRLY